MPPHGGDGWSRTAIWVTGATEAFPDRADPCLVSGLATRASRLRRREPERCPRQARALPRPLDVPTARCASPKLVEPDSRPVRHKHRRLGWPSRCAATGDTGRHRRSRAGPGSPWAADGRHRTAPGGHRPAPGGTDVARNDVLLPRNDVLLARNDVAGAPERVSRWRSSEDEGDGHEPARRPSQAVSRPVPLGPRGSVIPCGEGVDHGFGQSAPYSTVIVVSPPVGVALTWTRQPAPRRASTM